MLLVYKTLAIMLRNCVVLALLLETVCIGQNKI